MARFMEPTPEQFQLGQDWVASLPQRVRELAERFDLWTVYLLKPTGQKVTIASFGEDGTLTVNVSGQFNAAVMFDRSVFGIDPDDLEECDLPHQSSVA